MLYIFEHLGTTNKFLVDFGASDGVWLSNSKLLIENGWTGLRMDGDNKGFLDVMREFITAENICGLFAKYNVPKIFDLLSIDIDGNDYYVLKAILGGGYRPRVILSEFNGNIPKEISKVIKYNPVHTWNGDDYYGYSYGAAVKLAEETNYHVIHHLANVNLFYIDKGELPVLPIDFKLPEFNHIQHQKHFSGGTWVII